MKSADSIIDIFLQPGDFYFGGRDTRIRTTLGSCVSITMWHPKLHIGGMCHYMLASTPNRCSDKLDGKYGEDAIGMFFREAVRYNTAPDEYEYKIFGGGNMFPGSNGASPCAASPSEQDIQNCRNVSCRNSNIGRALLKKYGLNVVAEHLGGIGHRNVIFEIWSGHVWVRQLPVLDRMGQV